MTDKLLSEVETLDERINELLFMAFVGMYVRNEDGDFVPITDDYGVLKTDFAQSINQLIEAEKVKELEKLLTNTSTLTINPDKPTPLHVVSAQPIVDRIKELKVGEHSDG